MTVQCFEPTWDSLTTYTCPEWFRDAKFGVWAHWGPQSGPMIGDWYARNLYMEDHPQGIHHRRVYGHPSKVGWKDMVKLWKAEKFDPEALIEKYKACGAKYFCACAVHTDNFDCWNSKHHAWNSVKMGPCKDIIGLWAGAARAKGLRFGVTEHNARSYSWFNTNKGADMRGPYAGMPYDGSDPKYVDFYFPPHDDTSCCYPLNPTEEFMEGWRRRTMDLIDQYDPDLLYSDGGVPFGQVGRELMAYYYNRNLERHDGRLEAVYALKDPRSFHRELNLGEYREGIGVLDVERGVIEEIHENPWQTDTCVGGWFYDTRAVYKRPVEIISMLVDVVSKNGNMLLNFPQRPDGTLDEEEHWILEQIGGWLRINGEAIYDTRPWKVYGEGETKLAAGAFAVERTEKKPFTAQDMRFTQKGDAVYAILLARPGREVVILSLADTPVEKVQLLGTETRLQWQESSRSLRVSLPETAPGDYAWTLKITCR